jgi:hypothetical protein
MVFISLSSQARIYLKSGIMCQVVTTASASRRFVKRTLSWERPVFEMGGPVIDLRTCDDDPLGRDEIRTRPRKVFSAE